MLYVWRNAKKMSNACNSNKLTPLFEEWSHQSRALKEKSGFSSAMRYWIRLYVEMGTLPGLLRVAEGYRHALKSRNPAKNSVHLWNSGKRHFLKFVFWISVWKMENFSMNISYSAVDEKYARKGQKFYPWNWCHLEGRRPISTKPVVQCKLRYICRCWSLLKRRLISSGYDSSSFRLLGRPPQLRGKCHESWPMTHIRVALDQFT